METKRKISAYGRARMRGGGGRGGKRSKRGKRKK
jgi:hypothetical protein